MTKTTYWQSILYGTGETSLPVIGLGTAYAVRATNPITSTSIGLNVGDAAADTKNWELISLTSGEIRLRTANDAYNTFGTALSVTRTGAVVGTVAITGTTINSTSSAAMALTSGTTMALAAGSTLTLGAITTASISVNSVTKMTARVAGSTDADISMYGTGGLLIQSGTTGQRPSVPVAGMIRHNTTIGSPEFSPGSGWYTLLGGPVANGRVLANVSGVSAAPIANTVPAILDSVIGAAQGTMMYRNDTTWIALAPGNNGEVLRTRGVGTNPLWAPTSVKDIASLKAIAVDQSVISVGYKTTFGDGWGGLFYYDSTDVSTSGDDALIVVDAGGRRWKRIYSGSVNAKWFGAKGDDATDDTAAIAAALSAAGSKTVYLPAGIYRVSSVLLLATDGVRLVGESQNSTTLKSTSTTGHVINMSNKSGCSIENLRIISSVVKVAGTAAIYSENHHNCGVYRVVIGLGDTDHNMFTGVQIEGGASQFVFKLIDFEINGGRYGIVVGDTAYTQDVWIENGNITGTSLDGILLRNLSGFYLGDLDVLRCNNGVAFYPDAAQKVVAGFINNVAADTCVLHGWNITTNGGQVNGISFSQCWGSSNGTTINHHGFNIDAGTGTIKALHFTAPLATNNAGNGFKLTAGTSGPADIQIMNSNIAGNSQAANNTKHGIEIGANVSEWQIIGGSCNAYAISATNKQAYGIFINSGTSNHYIIEGVNVRNNLTGGISDNAGGATRRIENNLGYVTRMQGNDSISSATIKTVAHGLSATPDKADIIIQPTSDVGVGIRYWVSAADSTNLTLTTSGLASFSFGWSAKIAGS